MDNSRELTFDRDFYYQVENGLEKSNFKGSFSGKPCRAEVSDGCSGNERFVKFYDAQEAAFALFLVTGEELGLDSVGKCEGFSGKEIVDLAKAFQKKLGRKKMDVVDAATTIQCPLDGKWCHDEPVFSLRSIKVLTDGKGFYESLDAVCEEDGDEAIRTIYCDYPVSDWAQFSEKYSTVAKTDALMNKFLEQSSQPSKTMAQMAAVLKEGKDRSSEDHRVFHEFYNRVVLNKQGFQGRFINDFLQDSQAHPELKMLLANQFVSVMDRMLEAFAPEKRDEPDRQLEVLSKVTSEEHRNKIAGIVKQEYDGEYDIQLPNIRASYRYISRESAINKDFYSEFECGVDFRSLYQKMRSHISYMQEPHKAADIQKLFDLQKQGKLSSAERHALWLVAKETVREAATLAFYQ